MGTARLRRQDGQYIEIVEGIEPGERVVIDGLFALSDGSAVYIDGAGG